MTSTAEFEAERQRLVDRQRTLAATVADMRLKTAALREFVEGYRAHNDRVAQRLKEATTP